jgi:hypothetical protein
MDCLLVSSSEKAAAYGEWDGYTLDFEVEGKDLLE